MKHKKAVTIIAFLLLGLGGLHAQETVTTTGGEATGTGGTSSFTIGQVVYTTNVETNGNVAQGVQQRYEASTAVGINNAEIDGNVAQGLQQQGEVSTTAGLKEGSINSAFSVYPNPATNYVILKTENNPNLSYHLCDLLGKVLESEKVNSSSANISLERHPPAIYFLNVVENNEIVQSFKIIKN